MTTGLTMDATSPPQEVTARPSARMAQAAALVILGMLFVLPFVLPIHRLPLPAFDAEWLAAMLLSAAAVALGASGRRQVGIAWPLPAWLIAMVALAMFQYSAGWLHYTSQPILACLYALAILGAYWVGRGVIAAGLLEATATVAAWALVSGATISAVIQWLQVFGVKGLPGWLYLEIVDSWYRTRPVANLGQANLLSTYFIGALVALLFLLRRSLPLAATVALAFLVAAGLALTRSRLGVVFSFGVLAALWLPWALRPHATRARVAMTLALLLGYAFGAGAVAVLVAYHGAAVDNAVQRFGEAGGFAVRMVMWADALKVAATAPWLGVGFGDYAAHQYWIAQPGPHVTSTVYAHNVVLQTAAELGWPMALGLVAIGLWWLLAQYRERIAAPATAFAWALLLLIGVHALLEWPLESLHFAIPAGLLFALAEPRIASARGTLGLDSRLLAVIGVAGVVLALPMKLEFDEIANVTSRVDAERRSSKGVDEATISRMLALAETARLRAYADSLLVSLRAPGAVEASDSEIARHERILIMTAEPRLIARLVILYAKAGRMDESVRHAQRLLVFHGGFYADMSKVILEAVEPLGDAADPLRRQLAEGASALQ